MEEHNVLLERIPSVPDVQSDLALLLHCANARANCALRVVRPDLARQFAQAHDAGLWRCLCAIVRVGEDQCDPLAEDVASLPLSMGGFGLRSAVRTSNSAFWASWADSLPMVRERHPEVANLVDALDSDPASPILSAVVEAVRAVQVGGFVPPMVSVLHRVSLMSSSLVVLAEGGNTKQLASQKGCTVTRGSCPDSLTASGRCALRAAGSGLALSSTPSCPALRIDSHLFRVLLLRRLRLPLPPVSRTCRCGRLLDPFGHHCAACSRAGVLGRRGFALESVGARICREAGALVSTNVFVRDLDLLAPNVHDARWFEIVAEGLPLYGGAQLVVDTTLVSAHHNGAC